jgi:hypothetical protein
MNTFEVRIAIAMAIIITSAIVLSIIKCAKQIKTDKK